MNPTKKVPIKLPIKVIINSLIYFLLKLNFYLFLTKIYNIIDIIKFNSSKE